MEQYQITLLEDFLKILIYIKEKYAIMKNGENMKKVKLLEQDYNLIKDENNAFDLETLSTLATDYFKPYDYIFGDYSYGKLRLKGFYNDKNKNANKINKISTLDEYIKDYCAYGCKYFLLEKEKNN